MALPAEDGVTEGDRATGDDEPVEDVAAPFDVVATDQLLVRVNSAHEPVHDADAVRQTGLAHRHHSRVKPEAHGTYAHTETCRTRRLNQALSVLFLSLGFYECVYCAVN